MKNNLAVFKQWLLGWKLLLFMSDYDTQLFFFYTFKCFALLKGRKEFVEMQQSKKNNLLFWLSFTLFNPPQAINCLFSL